MKTVFDNRELCHVFASQSQEDGRGSNMSFHGTALYSYSTAIMRIGNHKGKPYLLVNNTSYSNTTSRNLAYAHRATHHIEPQFGFCDLRRGTELDMTPKEIVKYYCEKGKEKAQEVHKLKRMQYQIFQRAKHWFEEAMRAAEFFRMGTYGIRQMIAKMDKEAEQYREAYESWEAKHTASVAQAHETRRRNDEIRRAGDLEQRRLSIEAFLSDFKVDDVPSEWIVPPEQKEAYKAQLQLRNEWELEKAREDLEKWCNGDEVESSLWNLPVRLRVVEKGPHENMTAIETSHGAVIPYEDGKLCFKFCERLWRQGKEWRRNGEQFKVGHYHLDSVTSEGLVAGCHRISKETILGFASLEGWIQFTESDHENSTEEVAALP